MTFEPRPSSLKRKKKTSQGAKALEHHDGEEGDLSYESDHPHSEISGHAPSTRAVLWQHAVSFFWNLALFVLSLSIMGFLVSYSEAECPG